MRTHARLTEGAIAKLEDPLDRLAGAMVAAARMPEFSGSTADRGPIPLCLKLSESRPEMVGRAQTALTSLIPDLVESAAGAGHITVEDLDCATLRILTTNAAVITAQTVGNDKGVRAPDLAVLTSYCVRGFGADLAGDWYDRVNAQLRFPAAVSRNAVVRVGARTRGAPRRRSAS